MRYATPPVNSGAVRSFRRFAWWPRFIGWTWVWLECYTVVQRYHDPDGDGIEAWATVKESLCE